MTVLAKAAVLHAVALLVLTLGAVASARAEDATVARLGRALAAEEADAGKSSPALLPLIADLSQAQSRAGALGEAAALRRRALAIAIGSFGCGSRQAAAAMSALAQAEIDRRHYLDAEPLLIVAERLLRDRAPPDDQQYAAVVALLARVAAARGDPAAAVAWGRRAAAAAAQTPQSGGADAWRALGAALTAAERFDEAEAALTKALARDRKRHGAASSESARTLAQLANLYLRRNQPADAQPLIERALTIDQARLGATHPFIADDLHELGLVYEALHRSDEARLAFAAAIRLLERGAGRDTTRVAYAEIELSRIYRQQHEEAAADAAFRDARRILNKAEAEEHRREREV